MTKFISSFSALCLVTFLGACSSMPSQTGLCDDRQTIGCAPYTNERTAKARPKPAPKTMPQPTPEPVVQNSAPEPAIESAEPHFKQISKK